MTAPEPPVTADHTPERLDIAEMLLLAMDGDFLPGAGLGCDNADQDVPLNQARPKEVAHWAASVLAAHLADAEARLAAVEALLTQWRHDLLTNPPTSMRDLGWVQGVEEALGQIEAALHPTPSEQPAQGGDDT